MFTTEALITRTITKTEVEAELFDKINKICVTRPYTFYEKLDLNQATKNVEKLLTTDEVLLNLEVKGQTSELYGLSVETFVEMGKKLDSKTRDGQIKKMSEKREKKQSGKGEKK